MSVSSLQDQMQLLDQIASAQQKVKEYEQRLDRLRKFITTYITENSPVKHDLQSLLINQKQAKLGTIQTDVRSNSIRWVGGYDVISTEREIKSLQNQLETVKTTSDKQKRGKNTNLQIEFINSKIKEQENILKELNKEREQFLSELRLRSEEENSTFFAAQELSSEHNKYVLLDMIGHGGFSEVWSALDLTEGNKVAMKIQKMSKKWPLEVKKNFIRHAGREIMILKSTNNIHVVHFYEHFYIGDNTLALVMEYCPDGDLADLIHDRYKLTSKTRSTKGISENEARAIIGQVITGLLALRTPNQTTSDQNFEGDDQIRDKSKAVIHYDLKPANILFKDGIAKITDFGLSKIVEDSAKDIALTSQGTGTYYYAAPETLGRSSDTIMINSSVDTWSLGIIFYEMLCGYRPFGINNISQQEMVGMSERDFASLEFPSKISTPAKNFITTCLERDPTKRPNLLDISREKYVQDYIEWSTLPPEMMPTD